MDDLIKQLKSEGINQKSPSEDWDTKMQGLKVKLEKEKKLEKAKIPTRWFSISKAFSDTVLTSAVVSLGNSFELPVLFKRIGWRLVAASFVRGAKLSSRLKVLGFYSAHVLRIRKHHGAIHCVAYLKACQLALQKAIARSPVSSLKEIAGEGPFPRLDRRGLPRIIPYRDRCLIMQGGFSVIRLWLTLFSLYRVITVPGKLKLSTITDPLTVPSSNVTGIGLELSAVAASFKSLFHRKGGSEYNLLLLEKASSTTRVAWFGALTDPFLLIENGLDRHLLTIIRALDLSRLLNLWEVVTQCPSDTFLGFRKESNIGNVGQLAIKEEAAGKVRVFALVDIWTQSVLYPIHQSIAAFLKALPNDATFNQGEAVKRCFTKVEKSGRAWCFDLSAATDRLPLSIQIKIISCFLGDQVATAWGALLTERKYLLHDKVYGDHSVSYAVGQPMGAYSSFPMLGLTHHFIVQLAFRRVISRKAMYATSSEIYLEDKVVATFNKRKELSFSSGWYENYELLGDDIVIFNGEVASEYLVLMRDLGLEINMSKSVVSKNKTFEFAKITGHRGHDVSALPWKAFISQNTMMGRVQILNSLLRKQMQIKGWVSYFELLTRRSFGRKGDASFSLLALWTMFATRGQIPYSMVFESLTNLEQPKQKYYRAIKNNVNLDYIRLIVTQLLSGKEPTPRRSKRQADVWNIEEVWIKNTLVKPLYVHQARFNTEDAGINLATRYLMDHLPEHLKDVGKKVCTIHFDPTWSELQLNLYGIWLSFYMLFSNKFVQLNTELHSGSTTTFFDRTIDDLIENQSTLDRITELAQVIDRGMEKLEKDEDKSRFRESSPLKAIRSLLKVRKYRPEWTMNPGVYER